MSVSFLKSIDVGSKGLGVIDLALLKEDVYLMRVCVSMSESDLHVHCKSSFCLGAVALSLACLFSSAILTSPSLEDVKWLLSRS